MPPPVPGRISDVVRPSIQRLIDRLADLRRSADFVRRWDESGATPWRSHRKTIDHPSLGMITLDCETLLVPDPDQAVIVYSAEPGTPAADALALLRVLGTQDMQPQRQG